MFGVLETRLYPLGIWICLIMDDAYEQSNFGYRAVY